MYRHLAKKSLRLLMRSPRWRARAALFCRWLNLTQSAPPGNLYEEIPEILPLQPVISGNDSQRLNLLVPTLLQQHMFGGIATALSFMEAMAPSYQSLRIVVLDSPVSAENTVAPYNAWVALKSSDQDPDGKIIIECCDRATGIPVRRGDRFIATTWWSARLAHQLVHWQNEQYGVLHYYAYLIQDYEPGFYPWSSRYALAEATYRRPQETIAIFNTSMLRDYFVNQGYRFDHQYVFEPVLNSALRKARLEQQERIKQRIILVYGRPGVARNAFAIIVQALILWHSQYPRASDWDVISVGEPHPPVPIAENKQLISLGKLALDDYAEILGRAAIGISLMISPHPSYPPLEMAAFGVRVITNRYANKDLAASHSNILSLDVLDPECLARQLAELCDEFSAKPWTNKGDVSLQDGYFGSRDPFPFARDVVELMATPL